MKVLSLAFLLIINSPVLAETGRPAPVSISSLLDQGQQDLVATGQVSFLYDPLGRFDPAALLEGDAGDSASFVSLPGGQTNVGYKAGAYWGRFSLHNDTNTDQAVWLSLSAPRTQYVQVFWQAASGRVTRMESGSAIPLSSRPVKSVDHLFPIQILAQQQATVVFRIRTDTSVSLATRLWVPSAYLATQSERQTVQSLINGMNLVLLLFGMLLLFITRDRLFLMFSLYVLLFGLHTVSLNGQAKRYLWPDSGEWGTYAIVFFANTSLFFLIRLIQDFLSGSRPLASHLRNFFRLIQVVALVVAILPFLAPYHYAGIGTTLLWFGFSLVVPVLAARRWWQGQREARTVLAGWGVFLLFGILFPLELFGLIPVFGAERWLHASMAGLALVMAIALADRLSALRRERTEATQRALQAEQVNRRELEALVTERTRDLDQARREAETANRRKSELMAVANHELRTPLTTILGALGLLERERMSDAARSLVDALRKAGVHLQALVDNILDFSRVDAQTVCLRERPFSPRALAEETAALFYALAREKGLNLVFDVNSDLPPVVGDVDRLRQVLVNLLGNALKYTQSGQVRLVIRALPETDEDEVHLRFSVTDTGPGVEERDRERIFHTFERQQPGLSAPGEGIGLGLPISQWILRAMRSELILESEPGSGSTFRFDLCLPWAQQASTARHECRPVRSLSILLVDDHDANRDILGRLLSADDHQVCTAANGEQTLEQVAKTRFDLILLDIRMPGMDGYEVSRRLASRDENLPPVIGLSASNTPETEAAALAAGMLGLCSKPLNLGRLYAMLPAHLLSTRAQPVENEAADQVDAADPDAPVDQGFLRDMLQLCGRATLDELWRRYTRRSRQQHQAIEQWLVGKDREPDPDRAVDELHRLANTSSGLGLRGLTEHCLALEDLAAEGRWQSLRNGWARYRNDWDRLQSQWGTIMENLDQ